MARQVLTRSSFFGALCAMVPGGFMALVAAYLTGSRAGRFDAEGKEVSLERQSAALNVLGALTLWTGWFFFNASGVKSFSSQPDAVSERG